VFVHSRSAIIVIAMNAGTITTSVSKLILRVHASASTQLLHVVQCDKCFCSDFIASILLPHSYSHIALHVLLFVTHDQHEISATHTIGELAAVVTRAVTMVIMTEP
jgi:hypothetical protein